LRQLPPDQMTARSPAALDVSEANFSLASELEIAPATTRPAAAAAQKLTASADRTVMVDGLAPGRYVLQKARAPGETGQVVTYARGVTVAGDPREGDMTRAAPAELKELFGEGTRTIVGSMPAEATVRGNELWRVFVVALIAAYAAEAIFGFVATARRERVREGVAA
jgi:hypothetical protein